MKTQTTPLDDAPEVLRTVKGILIETVSQVLGRTPQFNEMLCIGNYPNMSMGWHQDGERGVGPVVSSMSFGGEAVMKFCMHKKYLVGRGGKGGGYAYDTILPGCLEEEAKRALMAKLVSGEYNEKQYREQFKALMNSIKVPSNTKKPILEFPLPGTGALMIQFGPSLNKRYEHMVENKGIARLVLTCRTLE
ncbi:hypothetical protein PG997_014535 [Apiospora hydei]|uniref:Alpha-ketoglutarate-dependent dioxygenase AlkB-like domain-containing protein n=1 Tax=Apiospora hydei TaxID=1337664 RepID=A0ABR1UU32_9PEZI